jgi:hypothetical protein
MLSFQEYLLEATSMDDDLLGHLTHTKDIPHEAPEHAKTAIDLIRQFHNLRQGKESTVSASMKHDGGASVHIMHDKDGRVGISDKHRCPRGVVAYSDEEIDKHFGKHPDYAAALKHLRSHGSSIVAKGHHVQGDILWTPGDRSSSQSGYTEYEPNRIRYRAKSSAPVGLAVHTEVKNGIASPVSKRAVHSSKNIFIPSNDFKPSEHPYDRADQKAVEHHLSQAEKLAADHTTDHLTPEHIEHLTIYHNRVARGHRKPTVQGYASYLRSRGETESAKKKSAAGQKKTRDQFEAMAQHVEANSEHFNRSIQIRHHLQAATDHALNGVEHKDLETSIDGKKSAGEGVVLSKNGRFAAKLIPTQIQHALGNNPRFPTKGAINESVDRPVHAFYGKVQYATIGHKTAIDQMKDAAKKEGTSTAIGLSNTPGPLGVKGKKEHAESIFNHPVDTGEEHTKDFLKYVSHLHKQGHTHLTIHAGSDRAGDYQKILDRYNGKPTKTGEVLFNFKSAKVKQVGSDRDEGELTKDPRKMTRDELIKTAKASRLREYAREGSNESKQKFFAYHKPLGLPTSTVGKHWENLKSAMKDLKEENEYGPGHQVDKSNIARQYMTLRKKKGMNEFEKKKLEIMKKLMTKESEDAMITFRKKLID